MMRKVCCCLLFACLAAGCQNQTQPLNPFAAYPQRLAPPPTGGYGQPAATQPYYQPQGGQAPAFDGNQLGAPPASFQPQGQPQGTWRGVSQTGGDSQVMTASYEEEAYQDPSGLQLKGMPANDATTSQQQAYPDGNWTSMQSVQ